MKYNINNDIVKVLRIFPNAFINHNNELIIEPKNNIYFCLNIETDIVFKCKMIAWLSRPSFKGVSVQCQNKILYGLNQFLGTNFDKEQIRTIYTYLGNDCNRELCKEFIKSGYNMEVLKDGEGK